MAPEAPAPRVRSLARDTRTGRIGNVMAEPSPASYGKFWLRPPGGGYEWDVPPEYVQLLDVEVEQR